MGTRKDRVKFNVGGKIFETTASTLAKAGPNSIFGTMFDENGTLKADISEENFIDRNPDYFAIHLDLLRTGELNVPANISEKVIYREALHYRLLDHVRSAKWGQLDGNRLQLSRSINRQSPFSGRAIRASPDGGCCVAHGNMVRVYNWMLDERPPITLDYQEVNDISWIDSQNIVVSACKPLGYGDSGLGLFNSCTGELKHKFQVNHEIKVESFIATALTFNSDYKIFSGCEGMSNKYGIGVWDQVTGKQNDFFYEPIGLSLRNVFRLQWLNERNCLFVLSSFWNSLNGSISLLDFRDKKIVRQADFEKIVYRSFLSDAIAMEDKSCVGLVTDDARLGFFDLRRFGRDIEWNKSAMLFKTDKESYPKLACHDGQLFVSSDDTTLVCCGDDWVLTSKQSQSSGGSISDISIGGDRLFALHKGENVFDIWETPTAPSCSPDS